MYFCTELVVEHQLYLDNLFTDARDTLAPSGAGIRISFSSDAHSSRYAYLCSLKKWRFNGLSCYRVIQYWKNIISSAFSRVFIDCVTFHLIILTILHFFRDSILMFVRKYIKMDVFVNECFRKMHFNLRSCRKFNISELYKCFAREL